MDFPIKNGDFPLQTVSSPEGTLHTISRSANFSHSKFSKFALPTPEANARGSHSWGRHRSRGSQRGIAQFMAVMCHDHEETNDKPLDLGGSLNFEWRGSISYGISSWFSCRLSNHWCHNPRSQPQGGSAPLEAWGTSHRIASLWKRG